MQNPLKYTQNPIQHTNKILGAMGFPSWLLGLVLAVGAVGGLLLLLRMWP